MQLSDRSWFEGVRAGAKFAVSEVLDGSDGKGRTVVAAAALHSDKGRFEGALAASIDLALLDARMRDLALPENATVFLVDQRGEPLIRGSDDGVGTSPAHRNAPSLARISRVIHATIPFAARSNGGSPVIRARSAYRPSSGPLS